MDINEMKKTVISEEDYDKLMAIECALEVEFTRSEIVTMMTELIYLVFNKNDKEAINYLREKKSTI